MARLYPNLESGTITTGVGTGETTLTGASLASLPVVAGADFLYLSLEPLESNAEIVKVTAHTSGASTVTVVRASDGTAAASHLAASVWVATTVAAGFDTFLADATAFATAAQGTTADSALQSADIDTLAELNAIVADATLGDAGDFATAAQGTTADSALQSADIDTLAELNAIVGDATLGDADDFATAAQGATADTAIQTLGWSAGFDVVYNSSDYFSVPGAAPANRDSTVAYATGRCGYTPFYVPFDLTVTEVQLYVQTAAATQTAGELGILELNPNNWESAAPTSKWRDTTSFDFTATGQTTVTGLSIALTAGKWYTSAVLWAGTGAPQLYVRKGPVVHQPAIWSSTNGDSYEAFEGASASITPGTETVWDTRRNGATPFHLIGMKWTV